MLYNKPVLRVEKQLELLQERGLVVDNEERAKNYLLNISYYRLSAYSLPFQKSEEGNHNFTEGTTFNDILDLYLFDRELRLLVFDLIERLEIALRTQIIYQYSLTHGAWWYEDPALYNKADFFIRNIKKIDEEISRSSEVFIGHYKSKYSSPERPPAWMTIEVISMGLLSKIFRNLKMSGAKKAVAAHFAVPNPYILESWMHSLTYVRNVCAHHSRLWNRTLTLKPKLPKKLSRPWVKNQDFSPNKLYAFLSCTLYLLKVINPNNRFSRQLKALQEAYPRIDFRNMGFPEGWEQEEFWQ